MRRKNPYPNVTRALERTRKNVDVFFTPQRAFMWLGDLPKIERLLGKIKGEDYETFISGDESPELRRLIQKYGLELVEEFLNDMVRNSE